MNSKMWENKINQQNVKKLKLAGYYFLGPDNGELACVGIWDWQNVKNRRDRTHAKKFFRNKKY